MIAVICNKSYTDVAHMKYRIKNFIIHIFKMLMKQFQLDTWRTSHKLGDPVDIVLPTASIREANVHFAGLKIATQIIISNVER